MNVTTAPTENVWTIVVAAGSGARFGGPKQFSMLGDRRVLDWSTETAHGVSAGVVVVLPANDADREGGVVGGDTRSESVRRGLAAVPADATIICIHDAARPFASAHLYREVISQVHRGADGAVPALAVTDTIKQVNALNADVLRAAHASSPEGTDDATLVEQLGKQVVVVAGEVMNRKLTTPEDLEWARAMTRTES